MNSIRFVPSSVHSIFDFIGGIALIACPFVFGFYGMGGIVVILPIILGVGLILYSLLTDYERGIPGLKFIPMQVHLILDFVAAVFLIAAPFLFGFASQGLNVWLPFVVAGVGVILLVLVSQTRAYMKTKASEKAAA
jgi:hypothetical protein